VGGPTAPGPHRPLLSHQRRPRRAGPAAGPGLRAPGTGWGPRAGRGRRAGWGTGALAGRF